MPMIRQINGVVFEVAAVMTNQQWSQISKQLNSDMTSAQEAHEAAVQRGLVRSLKKTRTHLLTSATISRLD
jgi:hypothetical protein